MALSLSPETLHRQGSDVRLHGTFPSEQGLASITEVPVINSRLSPEVAPARFAKSVPSKMSPSQAIVSTLRPAQLTALEADTRPRLTSNSSQAAHPSSRPVSVTPEARPSVSPTPEPARAVPPISTIPPPGATIDEVGLPHSRDTAHIEAPGGPDLTPSPNPLTPNGGSRCKPSSKLNRVSSGSQLRWIGDHPKRFCVLGNLEKVPEVHIRMLFLIYYHTLAKSSEGVITVDSLRSVITEQEENGGDSSEFRSLRIMTAALLAKVMAGSTIILGLTDVLRASYPGILDHELEFLSDSEPAIMRSVCQGTEIQSTGSAHPSKGKVPKDKGAKDKEEGSTHKVQTSSTSSFFPPAPGLPPVPYAPLTHEELRMVTETFVRIPKNAQGNLYVHVLVDKLKTALPEVFPTEREAQAQLHAIGIRRHQRTINYEFFLKFVSSNLASPTPLSIERLHAHVTGAKPYRPPLFKNKMGTANERDADVARELARADSLATWQTPSVPVLPRLEYYGRASAQRTREGSKSQPYVPSQTSKKLIAARKGGTVAPLLSDHSKARLGVSHSLTGQRPASFRGTPPRTQQVGRSLDGSVPLGSSDSGKARSWRSLLRFLNPRGSRSAKSPKR